MNGKTWTDTDVAKLKELHSGGFDVEQISYKLGRSYKAIENKSRTLGLKRSRANRYKRKSDFMIGDKAMRVKFPDNPEQLETIRKNKINLAIRAKNPTNPVYVCMTYRCESGTEGRHCGAHQREAMPKDMTPPTKDGRGAQFCKTMRAYG